MRHEQQQVAPLEAMVDMAPPTIEETYSGTPVDVYTRTRDQYDLAA